MNAKFAPGKFAPGRDGGLIAVAIMLAAWLINVYLRATEAGWQGRVRRYGLDLLGDPDWESKAWRSDRDEPRKPWG